MTMHDERFERALSDLINTHSVDNEVGIPDFILAQHVVATLSALAKTTAANGRWHSREVGPVPEELSIPETHGALFDAILPDYTHQTAVAMIQNDAERVASRLAARGVALVRRDVAALSRAASSPETGDPR
jgi:hypothetical protein